MDQSLGNIASHETEGKDKGRVPIESSKQMGKEDPLETIAGPSALPALEGLLREFPVFPEDLPAETS